MDERVSMRGRLVVLRRESPSTALDRDTVASSPLSFDVTSTGRELNDVCCRQAIWSLAPRAIDLCSRCSS